MAGALSRKLGELDEAAEREKRFSSDVAHELRTPVTGLVAAAALLDDSRAAGMVRERASALAALVEDLLEVMRLESGEHAAARPVRPGASWCATSSTCGCRAPMSTRRTSSPC